jgi:hypothetical protein
MNDFDFAVKKPEDAMNDFDSRAKKSQDNKYEFDFLRINLKMT